MEWSIVRKIYRRCEVEAVVGLFPKMLEAMDGRKQAHRDVPVAFVGKGPTTASPAKPSG